MNPPPLTPLVPPRISISTPWLPRTAKRSSMMSLESVMVSFTPSVKCAASVCGYMPRSFAKKLLTPSHAITTEAVRSPSGRSVCTPITSPLAPVMSPVTVVLHTKVAPASTALFASQLSKSGRNAVAPLYGASPQASDLKSMLND